MSILSQRALVLPLAALLAGCATTSPGSAPLNSSAAREDASVQTERTRRSHGELLHEDIIEARHNTALDAVRAMRPQWLRKRGLGSISRPEMVKVYINGMLRGGPQALREVNSDSILSIQYMNASDATQRFGTDHASGAIIVLTR